MTKLLLNLTVVQASQFILKSLANVQIGYLWRLLRVRQWPKHLNVDVLIVVNQYLNHEVGASHYLGSA